MTEVLLVITRTATGYEVRTPVLVFFCLLAILGGVALVLVSFGLRK